MAKFQNVIKGLQILAKYHPECEVYTEHGILYAGDGPEKPGDTEISELDLVALENNDWHFSNEFMGWAIFT